MFNITEALPPIILTEKDLMALDKLLTLEPGGKAKGNNYIAEYLERELNRANVVADNDLPDNIVRMYSTVTYSIDTVGEDRRVTLVYPNEANIDAGKVSILTPIGAALIGMKAGNKITYNTPNGKAHILTVIAVNPPHNEGGAK